MGPGLLLTVMMHPPAQSISSFSVFAVPQSTVMLGVVHPLWDGTRVSSIIVASTPHLTLPAEQRWG